MNSHKKEKSKSALLEEERKMKEEARLKLVRREWYIQQQEERKHEARKLKMIEEYERRRAQTLKIDHKQRSLQRSKSHSPQRRTTDYILKALKELKISPSNYKKNTIIDEKDQDLRKNKINIYNGRVCKTSQNISKNKIDRDIGNLDDIVPPRRKEKQLSDEESTDTWTSTPSGTYKKVTRYRSRSSPPSNRAKERKQDYDENKFSSRSRSREQDYDENKFSSRRSRLREQDYDENKLSSRRNRSREPDVRVSSSHSELSTNCPPSCISYNTRMRFPGPMPMYRIQAPPMIWPIAPGLFPAPFPPSTMWRSLQPPRFANYNLGERFYRGPC